MGKGIYPHKPHQGFQKGELNPSKSLARRKEISLRHRGEKLSEEHKNKIRYASKMLGLLPPACPKGYKWPRELVEKRRQTLLKHYDNIGRKYREKHGGAQCATWRKAIFERDDYTCKECGIQGGYLEAHHIKSWARHPNLRFDMDNGVTLCKACHKLTSNYGNKKIYA